MAAHESDSAVGAVLRRNIRRLLAGRGWSQADLYSRLGVSRGTWSQYFKGPNGPHLVTLQRIAEALEVPVEELVREEVRS